MATATCKSIEDLKQVALRSENGTPVLLQDVARVELGPDERRGITELNGEGEAVGGIALQRFGENALDVIENVKAKIDEIGQGLPEGVSIQSVYDRSELIFRAIDNLKHTLIEESIVVALVCFVFLLHVRSALVAIIMLPIGVLIAMIVMQLLGVSSNIMSLGGIAIAIGAMIDAAIVMIENAHKHLERAPAGKSRAEVIIDAAVEVGPALFFSLLIVTVSFLPVFALEAQEGRLFHPLAFTKTFAMAGAALLSVTLVPVLMLLFVRGRIIPEGKNPLNRLLIWIYRPVIRLVLRAKTLTILLALVALAATWIPISRLGSEFMPNLNEGTLMFMPTTLPGLSVTKAGELLQTQDKIIKIVPGGGIRVRQGRPRGNRDRSGADRDGRDHHQPEAGIRMAGRHHHRQPDRRDGQRPAAAGRQQRLDHADQGPHRHALDRHPHAGRHQGDRHRSCRDGAPGANQIEAVVRKVPGTTSAFAERIGGSYYLNIMPDRAELARNGISIADFQEAIGMALGGETVTTTVEGRQRYSVNLRYPRGFRDNPDTIAREVLIDSPSGAAIPLGQLAKIELSQGPSTIRTENALLALYIYIDIRGRDLGGYVEEARRAVEQQVSFPPGYFAQWSGQFEYLERAKDRLSVVVPVTLLIIFLLLYLNFRRLTETMIVMLSLPFALVGGFWLMYWMGFNMSVAVAVGFIALAGVAAETGVVMLIYLDNALKEVTERLRSEGRSLTRPISTRRSWKAPSSACGRR